DVRADDRRPHRAHRRPVHRAAARGHAARVEPVRTARFPQWVGSAAPRGGRKDDQRLVRRRHDREPRWLVHAGHRAQPAAVGAAQRPGSSDSGAGACGRPARDERHRRRSDRTAARLPSVADSDRSELHPAGRRRRDTADVGRSAAGRAGAVVGAFQRLRQGPVRDHAVRRGGVGAARGAATVAPFPRPARSRRPGPPGPARYPARRRARRSADRTEAPSMSPAYRQAPSHHHRLPEPPRRSRMQGSPPTGPLPPVPAGIDRRRPELSDAALVSRSWAMAFATLISRLTGFARVVLLAAILGAALSSAFSVANQLPNLVAALVLEATFTAIFVPVLARAEQGDPDGGAAFVRRLVTLTTTLLLLATALSVLAAPLLVRLMLGRNPQVNEPLTTAFAYLLLPQVLAYGLTSVFMAILNTRNVFGPPAWAPVVNNVVAIATLVVYLLVPGELSVDPVQMGNTKLLVLAVGTSLGVFAQTGVLLVAIGRQHISLRPLWGIDQRLKRFGAMAAAMVLYVVISQLGLVIGNQIASTAAASGPAIYNYTWLVLMLPFGMIGVTVLTVVMPRLSRNAAADDTRAVLADLSLATRLTLITLIPIVVFMTV